MGTDIENWAETAAQWIAWVRAPDHDAFWAYRPAFETFVGQGSGAGVEIGAGEGRISRVLGGLGYQMTLVEPVPAFLQAAQEARSGSAYVTAGAKDVPLPAASFDLVVQYNMLMDVDDLGGAVAQGARLLAPGGRLIVGITHPMADWQYAVKTLGDPGSYFETHHHDSPVESGGLEMRFRGWRRPLSAYVAALGAAGLVIRRLAEPQPDPAHPWSQAKADRYAKQPLFLWIEATQG